MAGRNGPDLLSRRLAARPYRSTEPGVATYNCRACGFDGHAAWKGELICPICRSTTEVGVAMAIKELVDEETSFAGLTTLQGRELDEHESARFGIWSVDLIQGTLRRTTKGMLAAIRPPRLIAFRGRQAFVAWLMRQGRRVCRRDAPGCAPRSPGRGSLAYAAQSWRRRPLRR